MATARAQLASAQGDRAREVVAEREFVPPPDPVTGVPSVCAPNPHIAAVAVAQAGVVRAQSRIAGLGAERAAADRKAVEVLHNGQDLGLKNASGWVNFWSGVGDVFERAGQLAAGMGQYYWDHPGELSKELIGDLQIAGGLALIGAGVLGEVGGCVLDATGVGLPAGLTVQVTSAAAIAGGATLIGTGVATKLAMPGHALQTAQDGLPDSTGSTTPIAPSQPAFTPRPGPQLDTAGVKQVLSRFRRGRTPPNVEADTSEDVIAVYNELARGGHVIDKQTYRGTMVELDDGTSIGIRTDSKSGGPAVDVRAPDGLVVKVHLP